MDPKLASMMAANLKKKSGQEIIHETIGDVKAGEKTKKKYKSPPGSQQLGMQAVLLKEVNATNIKLKKVNK
jgi:hypothetical protein